jgi:outer membrane protein assembly factor BamE
MRKTTHLLLLLISISLISCSTIPDHIPGVYRLDIEQGNIIDQTMIDELRPNMTKRQVLYILGSPMLIDVFHQKRWDYIYSKQPGGQARQQQRISLFFKDDTLVSVQGDYRPSTLPVARVKTDTTVDVPKRVKKKTVFGEIVKFFTFDDEPSAKEEKESSEEIEVDTEKQTESITPEPAMTPEGVEIQPLPDTNRDISIKPDSDLESIKENRVEQETTNEAPSSEATDSEPPLPDQQSNDLEQTVIENTEEVAIEEAETQEDTFSKRVEELSKPPVIQIPE